MKRLLLVALVVTLGCWLLFKNNRHSNQAALVEEPSPPEQTTAKPLSSPLPISPPPPISNTHALAKALPENRPTDTSPDDLKRRDPDWLFHMRNLDRPQPKGISEMLAKLTDFHPPRLSDGTLDGDILTGFRGYYEAADQSLRRIQMNRTTKSLTVSMEDESSGYQEWIYQKSEMVLKHFDGDPYSLVIILPEQKIYLKFESKRTIPDLQRPERAMTGWIILANQERVARVGMIDFHFRGAAVDGWPPKGSIRNIFPDHIVK